MRTLALVLTMLLSGCTTTFQRDGESLRVFCFLLCVVTERDGGTKIERKSALPQGDNQ